MFNLVNLMHVMNSAAFMGLSSVNAVNGFNKTETWPIDHSVIDVGQVVKGKGAAYTGRTVDLEKLALRLGPEAHREMRAPIFSFWSISTRGHAKEARSNGILKEMDRATDIATLRQAAKDNFQSAKRAKSR